MNLSVLASALALLFVAASAQTYSVDEQKLRDAVVTGQPIVLDKDLFTTADLPPIPKGVTVNIRGAKKGGKPVIINSSHRLFRNDAGATSTLYLTNLVFVNAPDSVVDLSSGSSVFVDKVEFNRCRRAINLDQGTADIKNSKFIKQYDSAVSVSLGSSATISKSSFTSNRGSSGGAIVVYGSSEGGAGAVTVTRTTFDSNAATGGGAVALGGFVRGIFRDCVFKNNNGGSDEGGAVYAFNSKFTAVRCSFEKNIAFYGGAVALRSDGEGNNSLLKCSFTRNNALDQGGAFFISSDTSITFCSPKFSSNTVQGKKPNNGFAYEGAVIYTTPFRVIPLMDVDRPDSDPTEFRAGDPCET